MKSKNEAKLAFLAQNSKTKEKYEKGVNIDKKKTSEYIRKGKRMRNQNFWEKNSENDKKREKVFNVVEQGNGR